jgi:type I restriction enzyme, S subunit
MAGDGFVNTISLSKAAKFIVDNRGKTAPTAEKGIALIATNCVSNEHLYPLYEKLRFVSQETYDHWFRAHPKPGDILLTNKGSQNGAICLVPDPVDFVIAQDMVAIRADEGVIDPLFLFAVLRSPGVQTQIKNLDVSGVIPHFKKGDFDKLLLPCPDRYTQEKIGRIYFELSAKIELNRRTNETLEAMARALYKSWFVNFDPVSAKAEGRDADLSKSLADLFPDSFEDSELGAIPKGWQIKSVGDLADVAGGTTPSTNEPAYWDGGTHAWATPKDLSGLSVPVLLDTERRITDAGLSQIGSGLLPNGTVLLSSRAPIGYLAVAEISVAINQGFIAMVPRPGTSNLFLLFWASVAHEEIVSRANGSTFLEISKANFRPILVVTPSAEVMYRFEHLARPLYKRMVECLRESRTLATLRDTLLPKLISGQLRVSHAELAAGTAV